MKIRLTLVMGCFLLAVGSIHLIDVGISFWIRQKAEWEQARQQLRRLHGWVALREEISAQRAQLFGSAAQGPGMDPSWSVLQGFQSLAKDHGVEIRELRPAQRPATPTSGPRLEAKVEGSPEQVVGLIRKLPEAIPGIRLETLQLVPLQENRAQAMLRIRVETQGSPG